MNIVELGNLLSVLLGIIPAPEPPPGDLLDAIPSSVAGPRVPMGNCEVPQELAWYLGDEDEAQRTDDEVLMEYRQRRASIFGSTSPPRSEVRIAGEFEPAHTLLLAYGGYEMYEDVFADIIGAARSQGTVQVLVRPELHRRFAALLDRRRIPAGAIEEISDIPYNTVWIRDFGPQPVVTPRGLGFVDGRYFLNCIHDDAVPTRLAAQTGDAEVFRTDLWTEGGNLLSDGRGLCLSTTYLLAQNQQSAEAVTEVLRSFYGCQRTVFLRPLEGNAVKHVDMYLSFVSPDVMLLGQFRPDQEPVNAAVLEENYARLAALRTPEGRPYTIHRVPMPDSLHVVSDDPDGPLLRTYLNMLTFNEVVLVPVYEDNDLEESEALEVIQRVFADRYVVPISADTIALDGGTIHCITQTLPVVTIAGG